MARMSLNGFRKRPTKYTCNFKNIHKSILRNQFPPQSGIVLTFENPPDIFGAVVRFVLEVPDETVNATDTLPKTNL